MKMTVLKTVKRTTVLVSEKQYIQMSFSAFENEWNRAWKSRTPIRIEFENSYQGTPGWLVTYEETF